jgi:hypothetical protein
MASAWPTRSRSAGPAAGRGTYPIDALTARESSLKRWPATSTSPASAASRPQIMEIVVVLPAPLGPSRP